MRQNCQKLDKCIVCEYLRDASQKLIKQVMKPVMLSFEADRISIFVLQKSSK